MPAIGLFIHPEWITCSFAITTTRNSPKEKKALNRLAMFVLRSLLNSIRSEPFS